MASTLMVKTQWTKEEIGTAMKSDSSKKTLGLRFLHIGLKYVVLLTDTYEQVPLTMDISSA